MTTAAASAAATAAMAAVREATAHYYYEDDAALVPSSSMDGHHDDLRDDDDPFSWRRGGAVLGDVLDTVFSSSSRRGVPVPGYAPLPPPPLSPPRRSWRQRSLRPRQRQRQPDCDDEDEIRDRVTIELEDVPSKAEEERRHEVEQDTKVVTGIEFGTEREEEGQEDKVEKGDATATAIAVTVAAEADPCSSIEIDKKEKEKMFHQQNSIDLVPAPSSVAGATASRRNCRPLRRNNTSGGEGRGGGRSSDPRRWSFSERHGSHRHRNDSGNNNKQERRCSTPSKTMASYSSSSTHPSIGSTGSSKSKSNSNNDHHQHHSGNEIKTRYHSSHHHQQQQQQQTPDGKDFIQTRRQTNENPSIAPSMKTTSFSSSSSARPRTTTPRRLRRQTISSATVETPTHSNDVRSSFAKRHGNEVIRGSGNAKANTKANAYHRQSSAPQSRGDTPFHKFDSRIHRCWSGRGGKDEDRRDHDDRNGVGNANNNGGGGTIARWNPATKSRILLEKEMRIWKNYLEARTFRSEVVDLAEGKISATSTTAATSTVAVPPTKQPTQRHMQQLLEKKKSVRSLGVPVLVTKSNF